MKRGQKPLDWKHGGYDKAERSATRRDRCAHCGQAADDGPMVYLPLTETYIHLGCHQSVSLG